MSLLFILLMLVLCIVFGLLLGFINKSSGYSYTKIGPLFTAAERSFLGALQLACPSHVVVMGKVRIADVLKPAKGLGRKHWQIAFNKISAKHFDFVLCDANDLSIIAVVELDDASHLKPKTHLRDVFVESACESAGLKLHRFKARAKYSVDDIRNQLFVAESVVTPMATDVQQLAIDSPNNKTCPKCQSQLITKTAQRGKNKGNEFLACNAFPACRYIDS
ncbi:DUF2726 domain-containing protein [Catenovulum sp. SX2]|uniref:DUF2726 domain-containing protein n=1 Tax=Catenovulum sp. SX2 TaxID=3398614 RepID=UPI003F844787